MAKQQYLSGGIYRLEHVCGHTDSHTIGGRRGSIEPQIAEFEAQPCEECALLLVELALEAAEDAAVREGAPVTTVAAVASVQAAERAYYQRIGTKRAIEDAIDRTPIGSFQLSQLVGRLSTVMGEIDTAWWDYKELRDRYGDSYTSQWKSITQYLRTQPTISLF